MAAGTYSFYDQLPGFDTFLAFPDNRYYQPLPRDWSVVITDVEGSTRAIEAGKYKQVNGVGVASIVALLNALKPLSIPYVFGGDGATACLPEERLKAARPALVAAQQMARQQFGLRLRIGIVPVGIIREAGHEILVGKHRPHPYYQQAMFIGSGLGYAEKLVKSPEPDNPYLIADTSCADHTIFSGFECRWDEIPSPHEETIALLVQATSGATTENSRLYQEVLEQVHAIYGDDRLHHPLREEHLQLTASPRRLAVEAGIRTAFQGNWVRLKYHIKLQWLRLIGVLLMRRGVVSKQSDWGHYKQHLIANTDYRKFDEALRMIIAGTKTQRFQLRQILEKLRRQGRIAYGIHASPSSLITCVVSNYDRDHVHFLDSANGGYAMAARELKQQLSQTTK